MTRILVFDEKRSLSEADKKFLNKAARRHDMEVLRLLRASIQTAEQATKCLIEAARIEDQFREVGILSPEDVETSKDEVARYRRIVAFMLKEFTELSGVYKTKVGEQAAFEVEADRRIAEYDRARPFLPKAALRQFRKETPAPVSPAPSTGLPVEDVE